MENAEYIRVFSVLDDGRVFALASDARNDNEWLLLWDRAADPIHPSQVQKLRLTDMEPELKSPTALMVTRDMQSMYIASSQNEGDVPSTKIFRFAIDSPFGESLIMERDGLVRVENMQYVAQIIENNQDRTLYAIGFNGSRVERDVVFDLEDDLQTEVTLAVIRPDDLVVTAANITEGVDLRFPIDAVFTCDLGNCESTCQATDAVLAESDPVSKNWYLSFEPGNGGALTAIRVVLSASDSFGGSVGEVRWLGPPAEFPDEDSGDPTRMFTASALQCDPFFMDWDGVGVVHAYGASVVPGSVYAVDVVHDSCDGTLSDDTSYSESLTIATTKWGDVVAPFYLDGGPDQPDFTDIATLVDKFTANPAAPSKSRTQLQPNLLDPDKAIDFNDISAVVDAFTGSDYPFEGPGSCN